MEWERMPSRYSQGEQLRLGKYKVGEFFYNSSRSRDDPKCYRVTCDLPGIIKVLGNYETTDEARARLEKVVTHWIDNALLRPLTPIT